MVPPESICMHMDPPARILHVNPPASIYVHMVPPGNPAGQPTLLLPLLSSSHSHTSHTIIPSPSHTTTLTRTPSHIPPHTYPPSHIPPLTHTPLHTYPPSHIPPHPHPPQEMAAQLLLRPSVRGCWPVSMLPPPRRPHPPCARSRTAAGEEGSGPPASCCR